jgi:bifunctional UDP-N-acetylglucosamine pyrophosphorylase/glucosamine-1-phosphate N-acetyltransferase
VVRDDHGLVTAIVEDKDAGDEVRTLREINAGVYCFNAPKLYEALGRLQPDNTQSEYYLTDVIGDLVARGEPVAALAAEDPEEVIGINNRVQLAQAETKARRRLREQLMLAGVTMMDPASTYVDAGVAIGQDTVLWPGTVISGETVIGDGCTIGPHVQIESCVIGEGCLIKQGCVLSQSRFGRGVQLGPYSHVRPGCQVDDEARVGSYSELVRTHLGRRARDLHFSYLGDAEVGAGANIGAGTVTCNYDGQHKHRTVIGSEAFIGSGTVLVAPVEIGNGAYTAAGSVITKDVPPESLAIARSKQDTHQGWVRQRKEKERRS